MQLHITFSVNVQDKKAARAFVKSFPRTIDMSTGTIPPLLPVFTDAHLMGRWSRCKPALVSVDVTEVPIEAFVLPERDELLRSRIIYLQRNHYYIKRSDLPELCLRLGLDSRPVSRSLSGMTQYTHPFRRHAPPPGFEAIARDWKADVDLTALVAASAKPDFRSQVLRCYAVGERTYDGVAQFIAALQKHELVPTP